ncbi:transcription antitermination factor NusB [Fusobacterium gastrosuis]|uniref:transcription antitermination factor NusB n=1 Tax=Fusobacterium gastrosuis TaxID=1755100 RepID=UPI002971B81F|nr:transcription antitermination factor NusB [Fusobacteriaceae bacterium]MDD7410251.1 transcription antitermination factor NusB [Fusobacteriaceae bacterium]MDY5712551.1 transcription antitermination factor NusB [Fusobacterium gastrosuis]MDY5794892.1 transcription antitermination factor NusB [Fusobacterium gastrosuis]
MDKDFEEQNIKPKVGRRLTRDELFKIVFEAEILNKNIAELYAEYSRREEALKNTNEIQFIEKYIKGISDNIDLIKSEIKGNMENWELQRIGNVERALLIISTYEVLKEELATEIIVNEAVELAKEYGEVKSHEFINGVLAKIIKKNR